MSYTKEIFINVSMGSTRIAIIENEVLVAWDEGKTRWADFMRASIATSARFTGARMISDYLRFYDSFE